MIDFYLKQALDRGQFVETQVEHIDLLDPNQFECRYLVVA